LAVSFSAIGRKTFFSSKSWSWAASASAH